MVPCVSEVLTTIKVLKEACQLKIMQLKLLCNWNNFRVDEVIVARSKHFYYI